jgi:hypothetical protein
LSHYRKREPITIIDINRISGTNFSNWVRRGRNRQTIWKIKKTSAVLWPIQLYFFQNVLNWWDRLFNKVISFN